MMAWVSRGGVMRDFNVRTWGPPFTQAGHWNPTGAAIMSSGQIGRSQRVQRTPLGRSGWR
jgi:hypothetical protein